jgi:hypothetical protein
VGVSTSPVTTRAARIHVTIDRLVLRGFDAGDRVHVVEALQTELGRVLSQPEARDAWNRSRHVPVLRLGSVPFTPGPSGSRSLGRTIARAIGGRGLGPAGRATP